MAATLPPWMLTHGVVTLIAYLAQFFILGAELADTSGNALEVVFRFVIFNVDGLPGWFGFALFAVLTLPWLFIALTFALSNTASTIATIIGGLVTAGVTWLSGLF